MPFRTIKDLDVKRKKVLVRVDFNVPMKDGKITDDSRIKASIPTIEYLKKQKAIVILITHLGRPEGVDDKFRLDPIAIHLSKLLKSPVYKCDDLIGNDVEERLNTLAYGEVCLLENLRFYPEEEANDSGFARALAELGQVYINDAFSVSHRSHASVTGITNYLPSAAGLQLQHEIETMDKALHHPKKPFVAILGGAKVSDKIEVIEHLITKVDALLIGGAMMFTFLKSQKLEIGKSKVELDKVVVAKKLLKSRKIILPVDCIVADSPDGKGTVVDVRKMPKNKMGLDIGPETVAVYQSILSKAKTVLWNGPVGMFEKKPFATGTLELGKTIAKLDATTILGGGDTADAVKGIKGFTHISTGGGASLEFFGGKTLPGIKALEDNFRKFKRV